jgi:hypothetical protein
MKIASLFLSTPIEVFDLLIVCGMGTTIDK